MKLNEVKGEFMSEQESKAKYGCFSDEWATPLNLNLGRVKLKLTMKL